MAFSRRLGVVGIVGVSWLVAVACNDDSDRVKVVGRAGHGGEAPSGGKSNAGGSSNNAGKGGTATAGSAGKGGTVSGGEAGAGGNAGMMSSAGSPGAGEAGSGQAGAGAGAGGGGESSGGAGGQGGAAGQGGAGGEAGAPTLVAASCSFSCANDDTCIINGTNHTQKCNLVSHRCADPTTACAVDSDCLPAQSFWLVTCTDDSGCDPDTEVCVEASGQGFCAGLPDPESPDFPCIFGGAPKTLPRFGAQGTIDACAAFDARCFDGACAVGCGDPTVGCGHGNGNSCSATTGRCECSQGGECTKTGICGGDGQCQACQVDGDCAANVAQTGLGTCVEGKCACTSPTTCVNPGYASASAVCQ